MRTTFAACMVVALLAIAGPTSARASTCAFADASAPSATTQELAGATLCLVNQQRADAGLAPLAESTPLQTVAQRYAEHMVATGVFAHVDGQGRMAPQRVNDELPSLASRWSGIGENLGWGSENMGSPSQIVAAWMDSPEHRQNVLYRTYTEVGIGVAQGAPAPGVPDGLTYAADFGEPAPPAERPHRARHSRCLHASRHRAKARSAGHSCTRRAS
jgi:uncharacterized protein YkwD